ncbi:hypothetical protein ACFL1Z_00415 [Thermodesulfobacteriota bacterium]
MKVTDSEVIKNGEQELIDGITADLDWGVIEDIFRKEHNMGIEEDIEYKNGDIVAHDNQIAYKLEFEVKASLAILLDREGNYISVSVSGAEASTNTIDENEQSRDQDTETAEQESVSPIESEILVTEEVSINDPSENNVLTEDDNSEDEYKIALNEISITGASIKNGLDTSISSEEEAKDKISQLANQVGEILEQE